MANILQYLRGALSKQQRTGKSTTKESTLTRAQARKVLVGFFEPTLFGKGFNKRKGSTFWRVSDFKSDVIEIRFPTIAESQRAGIPSSSFSIWVGSYFGFVPNIYDEKLLYQIDKVLTPVEWICHIRFSVSRETQNSQEASVSNWWCLTGSQTTDEQELANALAHINEAMLMLDRTSTLNGVLDFLESGELNLGLGNPGSLSRNFLLGCAYLRANNSAKALDYLKQAIVQSNNIIERTLKAGVQVTENAPLLKEQALIKDLIARLST